MKTLDEVAAWFKMKRKPQLVGEDVATLLNAMHPRTIFMKTLPLRSTVLDLGAGDGTMQVFRDWLRPKRNDLKMYAFSLDKGAEFDRYDGYELGDWEVAPPKFPGVKFDAVFCSHFIEHIRDPMGLLRWISQTLAARGRLYLEWPSPFSMDLPSKFDLLERGISLSISNFRDDATHLSIPDRNVIASTLGDAGFLVTNQGYVSLPALEEDLLATHTEGYAMQAAYWSKTLWAQYVVAERVSQARRSGADG